MEKINVAQLLKDCPQGMELDCVMFENLEFDHIEKDDGSGKYYIICRVKTKIGYNVHTFTEHGCYSSNNYAKCVIFPKGKTTWEGFVPPCKFKDGDIVAAETDLILQVFILQKVKDDQEGHCYIGYDFACDEVFPAGEYRFDRLATEEEKQKLFKAIKDNGYKWNAETKTLEKLPRFKVGDKVRHKNNHGVVFTITSIEEDSYVCGAKAAFWFDDQDNYELVSDKFDNPLLGALATFGAEHQRMMCIEECAELIDALAKYDRGRADTKDVITELADVCVMVEQMAMLFGKGEFEKEKERKLKRLQKKIDEASNL